MQTTHGLRKLVTQTIHLCLLWAGRATYMLVSAASNNLLLQVPLPRGLTALHWLQGQSQDNTVTEVLLQPRLYFSPRQSAAPGTQGAATAEAALAGAGPVAGLALLSYHV